ncbi:MAG: DUF1854 domain-containing protein [Isosphaeraceae bacterium]
MSASITIELSRDVWGRLILETSDGERLVGVEPVRAFPITDPDHWIAFVDVDGREVFGLGTIEGLSETTRTLLQEELALREFVPVIRRIVRVSGDTIPSEWEVQTDRGPSVFTLDNDEDVRRLSDHRVLITDSRKLRYQVLDLRALDTASRRALERFL